MTESLVRLLQPACEELKMPQRAGSCSFASNTEGWDGTGGNDRQCEIPTWRSHQHEKNGVVPLTRRDDGDSSSQVPGHTCVLYSKIISNESSYYQYDYLCISSPKLALFSPSGCLQRAFENHSTVHTPRCHGVLTVSREQPD